MILHLVRDHAPPPELVAETDRVVYLFPLRLAAAPDTPIDHDRLVALIAEADLVITW